MRVRIITRDIAYFAASDFRSINHRTEVEILWGDRPVPQGYITLAEMPVEWKPLEWALAPSAIDVQAGTGPGSVAAPTGPHIPPSLPRIDRPEPPPALPPLTTPPDPVPTPSLAAAPVASDLHRPSLSAREHEIHNLTAAGMSRREIAGRLGITMQAVSAGRAKASDKIARGARTEAQASA